MRAIKFMSLLACAFVALAFTSCISDDDNSSTGLTAEEIQACYLATSGSYDGNMIYKKDATSTAVNNNDTVKVSWSINTDSTMIIRNVPSKAIATAFTNNKALREAVAEQPNQNINCYIGYYNIYDKGQNTQQVVWLINPITVTYDALTYSGETHKVQVVFLANNGYSFGSCKTATRKASMQIVIAGVYIDGKYDSSSVGQYVALAFYN